jgi:hypothetical protein
VLFAVNFLQNRMLVILKYPANLPAYYLYRIMVSVIFWTIALYLLYRFIFGFLIPVITASRQMRMKVRQMQEQMNRQNGTNTNSSTQSTAGSAKQNAAPSKGDYIDFEEVK